MRSRGNASTDGPESLMTSPAVMLVTFIAHIGDGLNQFGPIRGSPVSGLPK